MGNICVKGEQTGSTNREGLRANVELSPSSHERKQDSPKPPTESASQDQKECSPNQQQSQQNAQLDHTMGEASNLVVVLGASVSRGIHRRESDTMPACTCVGLVKAHIFAIATNWDSSHHATDLPVQQQQQHSAVPPALP